MLDQPLTVTLDNHSFSPHFHDSFAIGLVEQGECLVSVRNESSIARPGDIIVIRPWQVHTASRASSSTIKYKVIYAAAETLLYYASDCENFDVNDEDYSGQAVLPDYKLYELMQDALHEIESTDDTDERKQTGEFLLKVCERFRLHERAMVDPALSSEPVKMACQFVKDNLGESISLIDVANAAGLSRFYFCRLFRRTTGLSPLDYLRQVRVDAAKTYIKNGMSLSEAATAVGFADQAHMTRTVKSYIGVTPGQLAQR